MCRYCLTSAVCDELTDDNDLSYTPLGCHNTSTLYICSGGGRGVYLIFESTDRKSGGIYRPKFCPECGRRITENERFNNG